MFIIIFEDSTDTPANAFRCCSLNLPVTVDDIDNTITIKNIDITTKTNTA